jgi:hypothetical protein
MTTPDARPFTAATSKLAYAQAFAGPEFRRRRASTGLHGSLTRAFAGLRRRRRA